MKSVYAGGEKVAEFESYDELRVGDSKPAFIYEGNELVYPNPVKDGLVLWYDFSGRTNSDGQRGVAEDLSGNGNHGTLQNFNYTPESGYDKNKLLFDGVDDKLTIPELELDETAMTVMHDGKLYAYEDDKVMTVGEDGEIVGSGKNLLLSSNTPQSSSKYELANYTYTEKLVEGEPFTATIKVKLGEGVIYPRLYNAGGNSSGAFGVPVKTHEFPDGSTIWKLSDRWKISNANDFLRIYQVKIGEMYPLSTVEWCKLERGVTETSFVSAAKDYKTTSLTPTSITDLQLYNKTLHKDELLHNAESKGLKKLKPGVVVQDGLVLHYDFGHESNTSEYKGKAFDYSGNGNHGVLNNFNFTEESGYDGNKLKFDGVDDKVGFPIISFSEDESWTAELSYRRDGLNLMFAFGYGGAAESMVISGSYLGYRATDSTYLRWDAPVAVTDTIEHFSVVYQSGEFSFYANGNLVHEIEHLSNAKFRFLGDSYGTTGYGFRGSINSAKVYNRPLTAEEIAHNYAIEKERFNIQEV